MALLAGTRARSSMTRDEQLKKARKRRMILVQVWFTTVGMLLKAYHDRFLKKSRVYDSEHTGFKQMRGVLASKSDVRCMNAFRMEVHVFASLCDELQLRCSLRAIGRVTVMEKVGLFLHTLVVGLSNRNASERFQRSGDTVSRVFNEVLEAFIVGKEGYEGMVARLVEPQDRTFSNIPEVVVHDPHYQVFKGDIGCIDGVHIDACIPEVLQLPYRGRKGFCSFNVMEVCDFDMNFSYISVGWERSAHDARFLEHSRMTPGMNFPEPPPA